MSYIKVKEGESLEKLLERCDVSLFPGYSDSRGESPYPKRYADLKKALIPVHNTVEKGALLKSAIKYVDNIKNTILNDPDVENKEAKIKQLIEADPIVYLNNHGDIHVQKVIEKVSEILRFFEKGHLSPYEIFLLLCAIQIHDVGNIYDRNGHETSCGRVLDMYGKQFIMDEFERNPIRKIAMVHGGVYDGDRDKLKLLSEQKLLREQKIRKRLLAALLRFGDELADDSSRCDRVALENNFLPEESIIYHRYSEALHTVKLEKDEYDRLQVHLSYEISSDNAFVKFKKNGKYKYLLDEIYDRTLKMEKERRYCMNYFRPCVYIDAIRVEIAIQNVNDALKSDILRYTLKENGYPNHPSSGEIKLFQHDIRNGPEEEEYLKSEWGL